MSSGGSCPQTTLSRSVDVLNLTGSCYGSVLYYEVILFYFFFSCFFLLLSCNKKNSYRRFFLCKKTTHVLYFVKSVSCVFVSLTQYVIKLRTNMRNI